MYVDKVYRIDLEQPLKRINLNDLLVRADQLGHKISIGLYRGESLVDISGGTARGYMVRADGSTATFPAEVAGNNVTVQLPQIAYAVSGAATLLIRVEHAGSALTVFWASCYIHQGETDIVVTQGQVLPSLNELINKIAQLDAAAAQANQAAQTAQEQASVTHGLYINIKKQLDSGSLTGRGLTILGTYSDMSALQNAVTSPAPGDAYAVGGAEPYDIYIWDGVHSQWRDHGRLQGAKGEDGLTTSVNGVAQVAGNVQLLAGHIPTADGRNVEQALGECRPELIYSGSWASGQITLQRAAKIYRLLVVIHQHSGAVVPVGQSMYATYRYPWYDGSAWHIVEQLYIISLANTTGQKITMTGSFKYVNGAYGSAADPIEKIYGIR